VLERVETDASFADSALESELTSRRLEPRDAALATELAYGTLRWQRYLDWILAPHSRRRLESLDPRVRVLLRMTAYQTPPRARAGIRRGQRRRHPRAARAGCARFVNAVLARSPGRRSAARAGAAARPREVWRRAAPPTWIVERWARYGRDDARR
jgi:16S rRNA (cytosine967-C5)-methyltransferase